MKISNLIAFCGRKQVGKSTACDYIKELYECKTFPVKILSFAESLKRAARALFPDTYSINWENKDAGFSPTGHNLRQILIHIGLGLRKLDEDFWVKVLQLELYSWAETHKTQGVILISDLRYVNEAVLVHNLGGRVIKIERPLTDEEKTENSVDLVLPDYTIKNTGDLNEYKRQVIKTFQKAFYV